MIKLNQEGGVEVESIHLALPLVEEEARVTRVFTVIIVKIAQPVVTEIKLMMWRIISTKYKVTEEVNPEV